MDNFMKKLMQSIIFVIIVLLSGCSSTPAISEKVPPINTDIHLFTGDGGKGIRLAILQPKGINITKEQEWFLSMVQGSLTSDFNKFSKMTILDRQYLDDILTEQVLSTSGDFSEDDYIRIGHLTNAQYILIGSLAKITTNSFMLDLAITNTETCERLASFGPKPYTLSDIQGLFAEKDAAYELMTQAGVGFTEIGKEKLYETAQTSVSAETALAKGIVAEKSGATLVEVMQYYYQAVDYDSEMTEAIDRLSATNGKLTKLSQPLTIVKTGNIRKDAQAEIAAYRIEQENKRIDEKNKQVWLTQLTDCENYFTNFFKTANAPLELVYSTNIRQTGNIDMVNETLSLQFEATLLPLEESWFRAAEQIIMAVRKGLIETGRVEGWGFAEWPKKSVLSISPFTDVRRIYDITVALLDENENTIGNTNISLSGGRNCVISTQKPVAFTPYYGSKVITVIFSNVKIADITDALSIHIATINNQDAKIASENEVLAITPDNQRIEQTISEIQNKLNLAFAEKQNQARKQEALVKFDKWIKGANIDSRFFLGYVYAPKLPIGFSFGMSIKRFGGYFTFSAGNEHSDLPRIDDPSNPIETKEDPPSMDMLFGIYVRAINNFFIDVGLGFYGSNVYGLFNVQGHDEPVWCNIKEGDGVSMGFALQAGILYSFRWFYLSTGYRQNFNKEYTPSFYIIGGLCIPDLFSGLWK
jgi:hypothetical protein